MFVFGGWDGYESLNSVEIIDLGSPDSKFQELPNPKPSRIKNGVAVVNDADDAIYMFGGWDERETMSSVFRYDIQTQETHFDGFLPEKVEGHACVRIPGTNSVFIFGGYDSVYVTDRIMKYDLKKKEGSIVFG